MTKEQLEQGTRILSEIDHIKKSLDAPKIKTGTTWPVSLLESSVAPLQNVLEGFFDEEAYRLKAQAHIANLERQLAEL
jgi:hypothetical protein